MFGIPSGLHSCMQVINTRVHKQRDSITLVLLSPMTAPVRSGSPGFPRNHPLSDRATSTRQETDSGEKQLGLGAAAQGTEKGHLPPESWLAEGSHSLLLSPPSFPWDCPQRAGRSGLAPPALCHCCRPSPFAPAPQPHPVGAAACSAPLRIALGLAVKSTPVRCPLKLCRSPSSRWGWLSSSPGFVVTLSAR